MYTNVPVASSHARELSFCKALEFILPNTKNVKWKRPSEMSRDVEDEENKDQPDEEFDQKRWRADTVYEAVQQFINNLLGAKETKESVGENMNVNSVTYNQTGTRLLTSTLCPLYFLDPPH